MGEYSDEYIRRWEIKAGGRQTKRKEGREGKGMEEEIDKDRKKGGDGSQ